MTDLYVSSYADAHEVSVTPATDVDRFDTAQVTAWVDQVETQLGALLLHFELESEPVPANIRLAFQQISEKARDYVSREPRLPFMAHQIVAFELEFNASEYVRQTADWPLELGHMKNGEFVSGD